MKSDHSTPQGIAQDVEVRAVELGDQVRVGPALPDTVDVVWQGLKTRHHKFTQ